MEIKYQEDVNKIENCPLKNENGNKTLYRIIKSKPLTEDTFIPHSVIHKPRFNNLCEAWGLSTYNNLKSAQETFNSLSKKYKDTFVGIAFGEINDKDGIKYCTKNKSHYTFFPVKDLDLLEKFVIVEDHENN